MKREDLTNELFCKKCGYLGKPEEFESVPPDHDIVICPSCGEDHVVVASCVEWCEDCQEQPAKEGSNLCISCWIKFDEQLQDQRDVRQGWLSET